MIDTELFDEAVRLFNEQAFFECHEVLEDLWRPLPVGVEKTLLQGLLQVGVGFYHWQNANATGAKNLLTAGLEKLKVAQAEYPQIQGFVVESQRWLDELLASLPVLPSLSNRSFPVFQM